MKSFYQILVFVFIIQSLQRVTAKPIFKGLSFKKNYEVEISALPFKHISFIKEKWFPFKMIGIKHDIEKREVNPGFENMYSVNEVIDDEETGNFPGLLTSVKQNLDVNSEGEVIQNPVPVVENAESIKPVIGASNLATSIVHTSSVIPLNPSIIIAPSIQTTGSFVKPAAVVPLNPEIIVSSVPAEIEPKPLPPPPMEETKPIQPINTHVDVAPIDKLEESVSKLHTDISSVVPLNTLVGGPAQEEDLSLPVEPVKVEIPAIEVPKVVEEVKVEEPIVPPVVQPPSVLIPVITPPFITPVEGLPLPGKTGPPGFLMRGTRFVLYFGSVMLQLLSQMLSGSPSNLNQLAESQVLK